MQKEKLKSLLISLNASRSIAYTEDEIKNLYVTFSKQILYSNNEHPVQDNTDALHFAVLKWFANGQTDDVIKGINLIMGTSYTTETPNVLQDFCGCKGQNISDINQSNSCADIYKMSMNEYIKHMLGNQEFYWRMFFKEGKPNEELIDNLTTLLKEFLKLNIDLSFSDKGKYWCSYNYNDDAIHKENTDTIQNYIAVLEWLKQDCGLEYNKNKIKLYGEKFGSLFPKLRFV